MDNTVLDRLEREVLIADGAMGTMLHAAGLGAEVCPESLNLTRPDEVVKVHAAYVRAGCDIVLTHSFGANRFKLKLAGEAGSVRGLNLAAVANARSGAADGCGDGQGVFVAGNIGPSGQLLEPLGPVAVGEIEDAFREQAEALAEGGVDLIVVETFTAIEEAAAAVRAARATGLPVSVSFSFSPGAHGYRTAMGVDPAGAARAMKEEGAVIVGANCGEVSPGQMVEVLREIREADTGLPLIGEANAGAPRVVGGNTVYDAEPDAWAPEALDLRDEGARIIGGCCGTTPGHIAALGRLRGRAG